MVKQSSTIKIATRGSKLALWQANYVKEKLEQTHKDLNVELLPMKTKGDKILDTALAKIGGKGLFVKELEESLLRNDADIAVHSMKDVPVEFPDNLSIPVICERGDHRDAFVSNHYNHLSELPPNAIIGTSSLRRECQLKNLRPDIQTKMLRGNVNTRLQKLDDKEYNAIILAAAGLQRLEFPERIKHVFEPEEMLPAVGQGALGIECRSDDENIINLIKPLHHHETNTRILAERAVNERLNGGCQVPIAIYCEMFADTLSLRALVGYPDGSLILRSALSGLASEPEKLGYAVADDLLAQGADKILAEVYGDQQK